METQESAPAEEREGMASTVKVREAPSLQIHRFLQHNAPIGAGIIPRIGYHDIVAVLRDRLIGVDGSPVLKGGGAGGKTESDTAQNRQHK